MLLKLCIDPCCSVTVAAVSSESTMTDGMTTSPDEGDDWAAGASEPETHSGAALSLQLVFKYFSTRPK
jgi:hypothetical protein